MAKINFNPKWADDTIQFPRLLAEIVATVELSNNQIMDLCESMDLVPSDVDELFERAQAKWEEIKYG